MERILTNNQVEWLSIIKKLSEYEDANFSRENMSEKLRSFIETEFPGEEKLVVRELEVLKEKGFLVLEAEYHRIRVLVSKVNITKKGLDYLTMLEEDFAEKLAINNSMAKSFSQQVSSKDFLDYAEQISTIVSNVVGLIPTVGVYCQGAIPFAKKMANLVLKKTS